MVAAPYSFCAKYAEPKRQLSARAIQAAKFVGDGSGLTNLAASAMQDTDWIIAGNTNYIHAARVRIGTAISGEILIVLSKVTFVSSTIAVDTVNFRVGTGFLAPNPSNNLTAFGDVYVTGSGLNYACLRLNNHNYG